MRPVGLFSFSRSTICNGACSDGNKSDSVVHRAAGGWQFIGNALSTIPIPASDDNCRTGLGECPRQRLAKIPRAAGDQRDATCQVKKFLDRGFTHHAICR